MNNPIVSVIVLTYNNFKDIDKTIDSIYNQDYGNIELIISDDCSSNFDEMYINNIIEKYKNRFVNCIINRNKINIGTVKNFNEAIKISSGEIIVPLAADDSFDNKLVISKVVEFFNNNKFLICTAKRRVIDKYNNEVEILPTDKQIKIIKNKNSALLNELSKGNFISGACTYYKKKVFEKYGLFDTDFKLLEDYPFYLRACLNNEKIGFLDFITIRYKVGGISSAENMNPILKSDFKKAYEKLILNNKNKISILAYRIACVDYYRQFNEKSRAKSILIHLAYFDVTILKIFRRIFGVKE